MSNKLEAQAQGEIYKRYICALGGLDPKLEEGARSTGCSKKYKLFGGRVILRFWKASLAKSSVELSLMVLLGLAQLGLSGCGWLEFVMADLTSLDTQSEASLSSIQFESQGDGSGILLQDSQLKIDQELSVFPIRRLGRSFAVLPSNWFLNGDCGSLTPNEDGQGAQFLALREGVCQLQAVTEYGVISLIISVAPNILPFSTPFADLDLPNPASMSDFVLPPTIDGSNYFRTGPIMGKTVFIPSGISTWADDSSPALFIRAQTVQFEDNSILSADGRPPRGNIPGAPHPGWGAIYSAGYAHYGRGGDGGRGMGSDGGKGSSGAGGFGGASLTLSDGGSGGGGLIVIVADEITGRGRVSAEGGASRFSTGAGDIHPGAGGGGVIWIAVRAYTANLEARVGGGKSFASFDMSGGDGTARIFQILPNGGLVERGFDDRWTKEGVWTSAKASEINLPYLSILPAVATLADMYLSDYAIDTSIYSRKNPFSSRTLTLEGLISPLNNGSPSLFLRAQDLVLVNATLVANGQNAINGMGGMGGNGGNGSSGCGTANHHDLIGQGLDAFWGGGACGTAGGASWGARYSDGFFYGLGGSGGGGDLGPGGDASNGAGGGGNSSLNFSGGGGGGLIVIVADRISGNGLLDVHGGDSPGLGPSGGGAGGGGVIWVAAKSYTGGLSVNVNPGTSGTSGSPNLSASPGLARIFQINSNGSLTQRRFDEFW